MSAIYQQVDIESHTDIIANLDGAQAKIQSYTDIMAHLDGAQCLKHINKLRSNLTRALWRT